MYSRIYFSLLLAFSLGIVLVSAAPVDPRLQLAESFGKARRKFSLPKVSTPSKPPPTPPVGVTKPSVAPPVSTKPALAASTPTKPSITPAASSHASSVAPSAVFPVASSSASPVGSSAALTGISFVTSSVAPSIASSAASSSTSPVASSVVPSVASSTASSSTSPVASSAASSSASSTASSSASSVTSSAVILSSASSAALSSASSSASSSVSSATPSASSCPLPQTNVVRSLLDRRAGITSGTGTPVCGIQFRLGTLQNECKANAVSFTAPLTPLTKNTNTAGTLPTGTQCDHALELQALQVAMDRSGACTAIDAIITAGAKAGGVNNPSAAAQKQSLLSDMFDQINGQGNAFSLDGSVNNAKKLVVQAGLSKGTACTASPPTELLKAVNAYLTDTSIKGPTEALASTLDGLAKTAVNTAATKALNAIACMSENTNRLKSIKTTAQEEVAAGKALYTGRMAMETAWNDVLGCAAHLAA